VRTLAVGAGRRLSAFGVINCRIPCIGLSLKATQRANPSASKAHELSPQWKNLKYGSIGRGSVGSVADAGLSRGPTVEVTLVGSCAVVDFGSEGRGPPLGGGFLPVDGCSPACFTWLDRVFATRTVTGMRLKAGSTRTCGTGGTTTTRCSCDVLHRGSMGRTVPTAAAPAVLLAPDIALCCVAVRDLGFETARVPRFCRTPEDVGVVSGR